MNVSDILEIIGILPYLTRFPMRSHFHSTFRSKDIAIF